MIPGRQSRRSARNVLAERLHGLEQQMERKGDENLYFMDRIWFLLVGSVMDEAHASMYLVHPGADKTYYNLGDILRWMTYLVVLADAVESVRDAIRCRSPVLWAEIRESSLTGLELVQETIDKVVLVKEKPKMERDRQKSYVDYRRKPLEFEVGDRVLLKVMPWKGVVHFAKEGERDHLIVVDRDSDFKKSFIDAHLSCDDIHDVTPSRFALARCKIGIRTLVIGEVGV
ncbi:hypothetical protein Tco_0877214 [Tanacetum coccineum]|uniref:Reverse transcriptase domain-containing protein n=1 Tax=Tanacetum coccineum TaxID=301880 RepID=A0ABQ5BXP6_9ASTR